MPSFYTPNLKLADKRITIGGEEHHHISHVFRKKNGDMLLLTNGNGLLAKARINEIGKKELEVEILKITEIQTTKAKISVAFPLLKNKHDFMIVEKLTELGVKEFFPIITKRTVRKPSANTVEKFKKIAVTAIKQCDNAFLPRVNECVNLEELVQIQKDKKYISLVALEFGENKLISDIVLEKEQSVCLIIGPEGGFAEEEAQFFIDQNVIPVSLGNHILRAETAAIAVTVQLLAIYLKSDPDYY